MIRRRMNPTGIYAGLSSLILIAALPGPVDPQASQARLRAGDARAVHPGAARGTGDDTAIPAGLDPTI